MNRRIALAATAVASVLALTACTPEVPPVAQVPEVEQRAALVEDQADRIVEDTFAELAAADAGLDPDLFSLRVGGDAAKVRTAQYLQAKVKDGPKPSVLPDSMQAVYVSGAEEWPRLLVGVSTEPGEDLTPVVMLWVQDDVSAPYQLRGWAHMVPGARLPEMPGPTTGAEQLSLSEESVEPSPRKALEDYLELLREGAGSDLNDAYAPDTYRERLFTARKALSKAADEADGDYIDTIQPQMARTFALKTADGGALVFAPLEIASSFSVKDAKVSVPAADRPLVDGKLDTKVTHHYTDLMVLYVPGPGVDSRPAVVAADHHLVRVSDG
jgi:hypothetical protein